MTAMIVSTIMVAISLMAITMLFRYLKRGVADGGHSQYLVSLGILMVGGGGCQASRIISPDFQPPWVSLLCLVVMLFGALATFATSSPSWLGLALDEFLMVTSLTAGLVAGSVWFAGVPPNDRTAYEIIFASATLLTSFLLSRMAASRWHSARLEAGLLHIWAGALAVMNLMVVCWAMTSNMVYFHIAQLVLTIGLIDLATYLVVRSKAQYYTPVRLAHRPRPAATHFFVGLLAMAIIAFGFRHQPHVINPVTVIAGVAFIVAMTTRQIVTLYEYELLTVRVERREKHYRSLVQDSSDVIMICSATTHKTVYVSPAYQRIVGVTDQPLKGQPLAHLLACSTDVVETAFAELHNGAASTRFDCVVDAQTFETVLTPFDGQVLATVRDVTERDALRRELHELAYVDALTGLSNRHRITEVLQHTPTGTPVPDAVLFIDLDRFKHVNDTGGHDAGDAVLVEVAERLRMVFADVEAELGRLGGDEFVAILRGVTTTHTLGLANECARVLQAPFRAEGDWYQLGGSVGVAVAQEGTTATELLRQADSAMYRAKHTHTDVELFQATNSAKNPTPAVAKEDGELADVLATERFDFALQPMVALDTGNVVAVEALLRWRDANGQMQLPEALLAYARRAGETTRVTDFMLHKTLAWHTQAQCPHRISLNMSPTQVLDPGFLDLLERALVQHNIAPHQLLLEITAQDVFAHPDQATTVLSAVQALGVDTMIDDFGVGFSSMEYLIQLPVAGFKIDQSFVRSVVTDPASYAVVKSLLNLATDAGHQVVVEGVETRAQHDVLHRLGATIGQGYWYAEPQQATSCGTATTLACWPSRSAGHLTEVLQACTAGNRLRREEIQH